MAASAPTDPAEPRDEALDRLVTQAIYYWVYHAALEQASERGYAFRPGTGDGSHAQLWAFYETNGPRVVFFSGNKLRRARVTASYKLAAALLMPVDECMEEARYLFELL